VSSSENCSLAKEIIPPSGVAFIGAGPGDPRLISVLGRDAVAEADVVLYAGSLVNPEILSWASDKAEIYDTAGMTLDETTSVCLRAAAENKKTARLHTGDPSLYGAIQEQIVRLEKAGIPWKIIPGISSAFAASAAALGSQLTMPGISQTVIFTRLGGRTPVPEAESLERLAASSATLAVFLSIDRIEEVVAECIKGGRSAAEPCAVVYRASWPEELAVTGALGDIAQKVRQLGIDRQAIIFVGEALRPRLDGLEKIETSKLYDPDFSHGFRNAGHE